MVNVADFVEEILKQREQRIPKQQHLRSVIVELNGSVNEYLTLEISPDINNSLHILSTSKDSLLAFEATTSRPTCIR